MTTSPPPPRHSPSSPSLVLFIPIAFLFGLGAGYLLWGGDPAPAAAAGDPAPRRLEVSVDGSPSLGPQDAPVTIIEFSDFQCPYCQLWHQQVFGRIMANYPGQVRFVYRDLPIPGHPEAAPAAEAAHCAGEQGVYWGYHDALFSGRYGLGRTAYEAYAGELGLDTISFINCLDDRRYLEKVNADYRDAMRLGISSTPTFIINGRIIIGALPFEDFKAVIDEELAAQP